MSTTLTEMKWALESYAKPEDNTWKEVYKQSLFLSIVYPRLLLVDNEVAIDSFDLSGERGQIEIQYANANIGIKTTDENGKSSKVRIRLASNNGNKSGSESCTEVVNELKKFVPVIQHDSHIEKKPEAIVTTPLNDILKDLFPGTSTDTESIVPDVESIIPESDIRNIIDAFIRHPQFPEKVVEIWQQLFSNE